MLISKSEEETRALGRRIGKKLKAGDIVCLYGELGSGKTTMVKGIASAFGIRERDITSPSFIMISEHGSETMPLYHIDLYRTEPVQVRELGLQEYLYAKGVSVVEWAEKMGDETPDTCISVRICRRENDTREIEIEGIEI